MTYGGSREFGSSLAYPLPATHLTVMVIKYNNCFVQYVVSVNAAKPLKFKFMEHK